MMLQHLYFATHDTRNNLLLLYHLKGYNVRQGSIFLFLSEGNLHNSTAENVEYQW